MNTKPRTPAVPARRAFKTSGGYALALRIAAYHREARKSGRVPLGTWREFVDARTGGGNDVAAPGRTVLAVSWVLERCTAADPVDRADDASLACFWEAAFADLTLIRGLA